jgi:hypothetical protein
MAGMRFNKRPSQKPPRPPTQKPDFLNLMEVLKKRLFSAGI